MILDQDVVFKDPIEPNYSSVDRTKTVGRYEPRSSLRSSQKLKRPPKPRKAASRKRSVGGSRGPIRMEVARNEGFDEGEVKRHLQRKGYHVIGIKSEYNTITNKRKKIENQTKKILLPSQEWGIIHLLRQSKLSEIPFRLIYCLWKLL